jgi:rhomboid protease GluP
MNETPAPSFPTTDAPPPSSIALRLPTVSPQVTYAIIGITILVYILQVLSNRTLGFDLMVVWGAKSNDAIRAGELWRFFTPMLLHAGLWHIGFNMYALYSIGTGLEQRMGHGRFFFV